MVHLFCLPARQKKVCLVCCSFLPPLFFWMWESADRDIACGTCSAFAATWEQVRNWCHAASWKILKGSEGLRKPHTSGLPPGRFSVLSHTSRRPSFPQPGTELCCCVRGEWDVPPGFRAPLGPPTVANTIKEIAKYFLELSAFFPVLPVWEALIFGATEKINRICGSLWPCDALPTLSQCFLTGKFYLRNLLH